MENASPSIGRQIYFLSILLAQEIYEFGGGGGWTTILHRYAYADSESHALQLARDAMAERGVAIRAVSGRLASSQDMSDYIAPEHMFRDKPIAAEWRGDVSVGPGGREQVVRAGATVLGEAEGVLTVVASEVVAAKLNRMPLPVFAWLKPCMQTAAV